MDFRRLQARGQSLFAVVAAIALAGLGGLGVVAGCLYGCPASWASASQPAVSVAAPAAAGCCAGPAGCSVEAPADMAEADPGLAPGPTRHRAPGDCCPTRCCAGGPVAPPSPAGVSVPVPTEDDGAAAPRDASEWAACLGATATAPLSLGLPPPGPDGRETLAICCRFLI